MTWWLTALLVSGCSSPPDTPSQPAKPVIRVGGSETITAKLMPALVDTHKNTVGTLDFQVSGGGSGTGFRRLLDRELDIAVSSRGATAAEREQAEVQGFNLEEYRSIVGVDVVAVSVHPDNPIDSLTYDQVIGIFCTRQIDTWDLLGLDEKPIRAITRDPRSGTRALFEDFFCGPKGIHHRVEVAPDIDTISEALANDPNAISFVTLAEFEGKVLGLRPETAGRPISPSQQNIIRGIYPLYHDLYLYRRPDASAYTDSFVDWILSPAGQEVVDEARMVPLFYRPERTDAARPLRETIHFEPQSSEPNQRSLARLQLLEEELRERAGESRHIILEGYTDSQEEDATALSQQRAEVVRDLLKEKLPGTYFEIIPRGNAHPLAPNETPYGRQRNRRVQIYLADEENIPGDGEEDG